ncbi:MAG: murein biosynthesis integral membrane protein MurJ [Dermatophilus congolensis]|nr:murein biosynthesis integral membrane protein MurJ [Dermatophilus congolensis]
MSSTTGTRGLARASALMASGSFVSRILGVVRSSMIMAVFGMTIAGDAWSVANMLPNTIYALLAGGVLNAVLVPQITKAQNNPDGGREYLDKLITLSILVLAGITAACIPLTPVLVRIFISGNFTDEAYSLAVAFSYIVMPAIFFYGLYAILGQVLNAREKFGWFMWSPVLCNIVWIAGLAWFMNEYGRGIGDPTAFDERMVMVLGGSLTIGVALQALVLIVPLMISGFRYRPRFGFRGVGLRAVGKIAGWTFAALVVAQAGLIVQSRVLTSVTGGYPGKIPYDQAFLLFMTPHGLITVSLVTALFTSMSKAAAAKDQTALKSDFRRGSALIGVATIPVFFGTMALGTALTGVIYAGNSRPATDAIGYLMMGMMVGLPAYGIYYLATRAYLAQEDAKTPFFMQLVNTGIGVGLTVAALALTDEWRAVAVASSQAVANIVSALIALVWLRRRLGSLDLSRTVRTWVRVTVASLPAAVLTWGVFIACQEIIGGRVAALAALAIGGPVFVAMYVAACHRMRVDEIRSLTSVVTTRFGKRGVGAPTA